MHSPNNELVFCDSNVGGDFKLSYCYRQAVRLKLFVVWGLSVAAKADWCAFLMSREAILIEDAVGLA